MLLYTHTAGTNKNSYGNLQHGATYFGTSLMYLSYARVFFPKLICFCLLLRTTSSVSHTAGLAESPETELENKNKNSVEKNLNSFIRNYINIYSRTALYSY